MSLLAHCYGVFGSRRAWRIIIMICSATAALPTHLTSALAQETEYPAMEPPPDYVEEGRARDEMTCNITGLCNPQNQPGRPGAPGSGPRPPDPCYLAQNAMRPCTSVQQQPSGPVGVDPNIIGTWELPREGGRWVLQILRDGTYRFHSEAGDGVASNAGTFSASNGRWSLNATSGYTDGGTYSFQAPDIWTATGQLGTGEWRHPSLKAASSK